MNHEWLASSWTRCQALLLSLWILSPFFTAMIWALMIVGACWPVMLELQRMLAGRRALAVAAI